MSEMVNPPLTHDELTAWDEYAKTATKYAPSPIEQYVWTDHKIVSKYRENGIEDMAAFAAKYADAMIAERRKRTTEPPPQGEPPASP